MAQQKIRKCYFVFIVLSSLLLLSPKMVSFPVKLTYNASVSVPSGFYLLGSDRGELQRETLVLVTLPKSVRQMAEKRGYLPAHLPLLKPVAAIAGDKICRFGNFIMINHRLAGLAQTADRQGRLLPRWQGCQMLKAGEIFVFSSYHPGSFDGRYFGKINRSSVIAVVRR